MAQLAGKVIVISGASRGIGREIALRCAKDGAKIAILAKTDTPHPQLPGTIHSVAEEVEAAGGEALALVCDVRSDDMITAAVENIQQHFGAIDGLINNASAIFLAPTLKTPMKRFDLMFDVNVRATFALSQACLPHLLNAENPHILTLAPPLNMEAKWFAPHLAYTMSKYGMSMCTLGLAAEFAEQGVAVNSLWPQTTIATSAIKVNFPDKILQASRKPSIVADAAYAILCRDSRQHSGNFYIDEDVLREEGVDDFDDYALDPNVPLFQDLFL